MKKDQIDDCIFFQSLALIILLIKQHFSLFSRSQKTSFFQTFIINWINKKEKFKKRWLFGIVTHPLYFQSPCWLFVLEFLLFALLGLLLPKGIFNVCFYVCMFVWLFFHKFVWFFLDFWHFMIWFEFFVEIILIHFSVLMERNYNGKMWVQ